MEDAAAALRAHLGKDRSDELDRAEQIGVDLVPDLYVGHLLGGAQQPVAGVLTTTSMRPRRRRPSA